MTEIERKALVLLKECGFSGGYIDRKWNDNYEALCRAVERHEAFRQEVSDAVEAYMVDPQSITGPATMRHIQRFILPKPDPLVEVMNEWWDADGYANIDTFRAALAKHGLKLERIEHE